MSQPITYTVSTGNLSYGVPNLTYPTCKYFQPHQIIQIGTPAANPTELTYVNYFLYDYGIVSSIFNQLYSVLGTDFVSDNQQIRVSGHMEYTLRNQTNDHVPMEMIRWTLKKPIPRDLCSITEPADPLKVTFPVLQGNILNFMGRCMLEQTMGVAGNATNVIMSNAEITLKMLDLWNEYIDYKVVPFTLKAGKLRTFKVGRRLLNINTFEIYQFPDASRNVLDSTLWSQAFIPGATGLVFRHFATPMQITGITTDISPVAYSVPEILCTTKSKYTAYAWKGLPEISQQVFFTDSGITNIGGAMANLRFVDAQEVIRAPTVAQ